MDELPRDGTGNVIVTGFDVERILRQAGTPKAFAKAAAAACRANGLFDRCQADKDNEIEKLKLSICNLINILEKGRSNG